jgi:hypothetical protein
MVFTIDCCSSLTIKDVNKFLVRVFPPPPPRIPVGTVVRLREGLFSEGPLEAGQMAVVTIDDGTSNPYKVRTANGVEHSHWFELGYLVPVDEAVAVRCHSESTSPLRRHTHTPKPPSAQRKGHIKDTDGQGLARIDPGVLRFFQARRGVAASFIIIQAHTTKASFFIFMPKTRMSTRGHLKHHVRATSNTHIHDHIKTSHANAL